MRTFVSWALGAAVGLLVLALLLEVVLRFLPVNQGCRTQTVNAEHPILVCQPDRTFTWSRFPDFAMTNTVHANNLGFINGQSYVTEGPPLTAVIGDSLIEALMVPYEQTGHGRLAKSLAGRWRVYSFAASGAQLAQYLAYAAYARNRFHPARLVVVIADGDFLESFVRTPGLHSFSEDGSGGLTLVRTDFEPSPLRNMVRHSRLALYLLLNLRVDQLLHLDQGIGMGESIGAPGSSRLNNAQRTADTFLSALPQAAGLPPKDILLVFDAQRPIPTTLEQAEKQAGSLGGLIRSYTLDEARKAGFRTADMVDIFVRDWAKNHTPFEFPADTHWNPYAHGLFAQAVLDSGLLDDLDP